MKTERLIVGGVALLVGLLLGWMVRGVATYNPRTASVATYDDWRVACPAADPKETTPSYCQLMTEIVDPQRQEPIAQITVTTDKDKKHIIGFTLPHGVALEAGMGLKIGQNPVKVYQYRTCTQLGCVATADFDEKALKGATEGSVMFATLEGKPIGVPLSFKGYSKALSAWKSNDAKRHNWFWRLWS